jgi:hypothetical protein
MVRQIRFVDPFGNLQVSPAGVLKQFRQIDAHGRVFGEQQPVEHHLVDRDHLL